MVSERFPKGKDTLVVALSHCPFPGGASAFAFRRVPAGAPPGRRARREDPGDTVERRPWPTSIPATPPPERNDPVLEAERSVAPLPTAEGVAHGTRRTSTGRTSYAHRVYSLSLSTIRTYQAAIL